MARTPLTQTFLAEAASVGPARRMVTAYAGEHGIADLDGVALAVSEALTNVVLHASCGAAGPATVRLTAELDDDAGLVICVCDDGLGPTRRHDSPGLGLGLPLMASLADQLELLARPGGGTQVTMTFRAAG